MHACGYNHATHAAHCYNIIEVFFLKRMEDGSSASPSKSEILVSDVQKDSVTETDSLHPQAQNNSIGPVVMPAAPKMEQQTPQIYPSLEAPAATNIGISRLAAKQGGDGSACSSAEPISMPNLSNPGVPSLYPSLQPEVKDVACTDTPKGAAKVVARHAESQERGDEPSSCAQGGSRLYPALQPEACKLEFVIGSPRFMFEPLPESNQAMIFLVGRHAELSAANAALALIVKEDSALAGETQP